VGWGVAPWGQGAVRPGAYPSQAAAIILLQRHAPLPFNARDEAEELGDHSFSQIVATPTSQMRLVGVDM